MAKGRYESHAPDMIEAVINLMALTICSACAFSGYMGHRPDFILLGLGLFTAWSLLDRSEPAARRILGQGH